MATLNDFVEVQISISNAQSPSIPGLNTPLIATFHTHYPDRVRQYSAGTMLTQMVTDGFQTSEAGYKCAEAMLSAINTPAIICIGRRANMPLQTLQLACVDGTVGDAYNLTIVGSDGKAHALTYTNVFNPGTPLASGTVTDTNGSPNISFTAPQTMSKWGLLVFGSQANQYYALASGIVAGTSGVLTTNFSGAGQTGDTAGYVPPLAGNAQPVNGSAIVPTSTSQVGNVYPGDSVQFVTQLNVFYTVLSVSATQLTLTQPYTGTTASGPGFTGVAVVCTSATAATNLSTSINALTHVGTASVITSVAPSPNAGENATVQIARTDGFLNDIQGWVANGFSSIQLKDVTADPGITADLTAMQKANNAAWYGFTLDSNSANEIESAAQWTEATGVAGKVFFTNNSDWQNTQTSVTTDVFSELQADAYNRTFIQQNDSQLLCYSGGAILSYALSQNPGSYTLAYKTMPGVPADSDTTLTEAQALALNSMTASSPGPGAKNGNYYKNIGGVNWLFPGCAPSGRFMDLTIGIDWLQVNIQVAVLEAIAAQAKLPFDDFGIGALGDAVKGVLVLGSTPLYSLILPDGQDPKRPISVTVPTAASLTSAQRASRSVSGITFSAGLQGAIETATVIGTLVP